jgi:hypothetical protein
MSIQLKQSRHRAALRWRGVLGHKSRAVLYSLYCLLFLFTECSEDVAHFANCREPRMENVLFELPPLVVNDFIPCSIGFLAFSQDHPRHLILGEDDREDIP